MNIATTESDADTPSARTEARRFKVGDRVVPRGYTRDGLTYGYVRGTDHRGYVIHWPEIGDVGGGWSDTDLK